jgi:hypothetical protein
MFFSGYSINDYYINGYSWVFMAILLEDIGVY